MVDKFTNQPTVKEVVTKINDVIDAVNQGSGGGISDVKVNNTSVVTSGVANIDLTGYAQTSNLATVATSGSYNDLSNKPTIPDAQVQSNWTETNTSSKAYIKNKPTIPTVNNATLTIQKNGTTVKTFTANASSNVTCNITVPTDTSDLTNGAGYTTNVGTVKSVNNNSPDSNGNVSLTIPTVNNATLTIQKNGTTVKTFTANASSNVTCNITVPTKTSDITNDSGYTTNVGTVTSVNSTSPDSNGNVTLSIPAAQVQSNWTETNTSSKAYIKNKPTIPAAQIQSDWNQTTTTAKDYIKNKPTIPTVGNATITFTQGGVTKGTITTNQSTNATIALDAGGGGGGASITDVLNVIYPVGSIYVSTNSTNPIASYVGTWELVAQDRVLQGSSTNHSAGTTIAAGLPNITGLTNFNTTYTNKGYSPITESSTATGSLYLQQKSAKTTTATVSSSTFTTYDIGINANNSSTIYGNGNSTVQPPAYVVNIWKRTA